MHRYCVRLWGSRGELDTSWPLRGSQPQGADLQGLLFPEFPKFSLHTFWWQFSLISPTSLGNDLLSPNFICKHLSDRLFRTKSFTSALHTGYWELSPSRLSLMILQGFSHQRLTPQEKEKKPTSINHTSLVFSSLIFNCLISQSYIYFWLNSLSSESMQNTFQEFFIFLC